MSMSQARFVIPLALLGSVPAVPAAAETPFFFSTGDPDGRMATATRPDTGRGVFEIESADDFVLTHSTSITSATFTGLLPGGAAIGDIGEVVVEVYRVFPKDSDIGRTSGPPTSRRRKCRRASIRRPMSHSRSRDPRRAATSASRPRW